MACPEGNGLLRAEISSENSCVGIFTLSTAQMVVILLILGIIELCVYTYTYISCIKYQE